MSSRNGGPLAGVNMQSISTDDVTPDQLRSALDANDPVIRQRGARICSALALENVEAVLPHVESLGVLLTDDSLAVARHAARALNPIVEAHPDAIEGSVSHIVEFVDTDLPGIQLAGAQLLSMLVVERPTFCSPHADRLVSILVRSNGAYYSSDVATFVDDPETRGTIQRHELEENRRELGARQILANVIVAAAEAAPAPFYKTVDGLSHLLEDDDPIVAGGAADTLAVLAKADSAATASACEALVASLDHESRAVRARTIRALGYLGEEKAISELRWVAAEDPDTDVSNLAADTADFLASE